MFSFVNLDNIKKQLKNAHHISISGLGAGEKGFVIAGINKRTLIVAPDIFVANNLKKQLSALNKRVEILTEKIPLVFTLGNSQIGNFTAVLNSLASDNLDVLIILPEVLMQRLPEPKYFKNNNIKLRVNDNYNILEIISRLVLSGYKKCEMVENVGDFALRGDILDIFCPSYSNPLRISFFDEVVESISLINLDDYKTEEKLRNAEICINNIFSFSDAIKADLTKSINASLSKSKLSGEAILRLNEVCAAQVESLQNNLVTTSGIFMLPFLKYFNASILDYFDEEDLLVFDEAKLITDALEVAYTEFVKSYMLLSDQGEILKEHKDIYIEKNKVFSNIENRFLISFYRISGTNKIFVPKESIGFTCIPTQKYASNWGNFTYDLKVYHKKKTTVFIACGCALTFNKVRALLLQNAISFNEVGSFEKCIDFEINISEQNIPLSAGFFEDGFVIIGSNDLNTHPVERAASKAKAKSSYLPKTDEYVVHDVHGIGKCKGVQKLKLSEALRDYIIIEYSGGDVLYLPTENVDHISAYVGEIIPKCNKLGGVDFYKTKQKVKDSVREMAIDLLKIYGIREKSKGYKYSEDTYLQKQFEDAFAFDYTADQIMAINDLKADMQSSRIVERLICGDVGFGKTEVALVAAFKAIQEGRQVALICPTTILCEQHFNTALARLKPFGANVAVINRFKTKAEQQKILGDLAAGKIDLICGTHRLLSSDVIFKDLGLLILDEEQRFGVEHKEKLKEIKNNVDVITLTATPIPRTLYMSLVGIRDISYLNTPPKDRIPVETFVIDYSDTLLADACKKEIDRDGQVLIVYNRVETIYDFYAKVKQLLPGINIGVAHGQMAPKELENNIYKLFSKQTQILISTVLIENGIDLPFANTLIIIDADKLGLSQLYQLRGRIGRSTRTSYAYFTFARNKVLSVEAYKRLDALMEFSGSGNGYKIALRDLEIRGAGDVLGSRQHGHIQKVGYDLYVKLLNEAVSEIKGEQIKPKKEVKIDIAINAYLPSEYIKEEENRIIAYTKISKISNVHELGAVKEHFNNAYGHVPDETEQLLNVALIKNLSEKVCIKSVKIDSRGAKIVFYDDVIKSGYLEKLEKLEENIKYSHETAHIVEIAASSSIIITQGKVLKFLLNLINANNSV